jgi:hypothetical protein
LIHEEKPGVPKYESMEFEAKHSDYCILIPVLNEHTRIEAELQRAMDHGIHQLCDVILCDGASTDGSADPETLRALGVNTLLVKRGPGKQGAQLRMGFSYALARGYAGFVTIDGNNKDSIEDVPRFLEKLAQGYDFVQGSRFVRGGRAVHTPLGRYLAVRLIHAPVISLTAGQCFHVGIWNIPTCSRCVMCLSLMSCWRISPSAQAGLACAPVKSPSRALIQSTKRRRPRSGRFARMRSCSIFSGTICEVHISHETTILPPLQNKKSQQEAHLTDRVPDDPSHDDCLLDAYESVLPTGFREPRCRYACRTAI